MVLVTVVELVTVVVIDVESSPVDVGFTYMGAAVLLGKIGQPIGVHYALLLLSSITAICLLIFPSLMSIKH